MIDIEDIINSFDEYIDIWYDELTIFGDTYKVSQILKDIDHNKYCKGLSAYIDRYYDKIGEDEYRCKPIKE